MLTDIGEKKKVTEKQKQTNKQKKKTHNITHF